MATATKTSLKKWSCTASNFIALIPSRLSYQLNSKGLNQSSGKEKESCCLVFPSATIHEFMHFHIVVVQRRQRNVQTLMMHMQSCCFANLNLLLFCSSYCRHCHHSLSSLNSHQFTRVSAITFFKFSINRPNNCIQMPPSLLLFNKCWVWWALICIRNFFLTVSVVTFTYFDSVFVTDQIIFRLGYFLFPLSLNPSSWVIRARRLK